MTALRLRRHTVLFLLISCTALACATGSSTKTGAYPRLIERAKKANTPMIMLSGVDTFAVTSAVVERSKRQVTVHLGKMDSLYQSTLTVPTTTKKYLRLFMHDSTSYTLDEPHTIPLSRIARIERVE